MNSAEGCHDGSSGCRSSDRDFERSLRRHRVLPMTAHSSPAALVFRLRAGVPIAAGLAATLLFRGLSYWLPMAPGILLVRRETMR